MTGTRPEGTRDGDLVTVEPLSERGLHVREPNEYQTGHVPGAKLVPLNTFLRSPRQHLPASGPVLFICAMGQRSAGASEMAAASGATDVYNIEGGTNGWIAKGFPTEQ